MNYATIVLFSAAITLVFTLGSVFEGVRSRGPDLWKEFAHCPLCVGVWVGSGVSGLAHRWSGLEPSFPMVFTCLALGALTGCAALLFSRVVVWLDLAAFAEEARGEFYGRRGQEMFKKAMQSIMEEREKQREERARIRAERAAVEERRTRG